MDRKLTGKRPTFSTNKTTINYTFVLILVALIAIGLWFASQVHDPEGRFEPLFLPTPTATRTVDSLVLEGEAYFEAGNIYDPVGKDAIDAELEAKLPFMLEKGGYIPHIDHAVSKDISFENFSYYRQKLREIVDRCRVD